VVAENAQALGCDGPGCDVKHRGGKFPGDLEHIRDHQQQALAGGERGGQRASGQRTVNRAGGAGFALHFLYVGNGTEYIFLSLSGELVGEFAHGGRRGNRINRDYFVCCVGNVRYRGVTVNNHHLFIRHSDSSSFVVFGGTIQDFPN
jgi:hypothetical protein